LIPILLYHRIRSQATREKLDRRQEGLLVLLTLRPVGFAFLGGLVLYLIHPAMLRWAFVPVPGKLRLLGMGLVLLGGILLIWTLRHLGKNLTDTVVTRRAHTLVTSGPYRWVRHPFYDAVALLILAAFLIASNAYFLVTGIATLALLWIRTRKEEELLLARFGNQYRAYMIRTGRFFPRS
jgi:protein-S-isoprenylcysteine O-methyltransferase Ste14